MDIKEEFQALPNWGNVADPELQALLDAAEVIQYEHRAALTRQHHPATWFYFMYSGAVRYHIQLDTADDHLLVGETDRCWTAIGWSGFRTPHRYTVTVQCEQPCHVLRWDCELLQALLECHPRLGYSVLNLVLETGVEIQDQTRNLLAASAKAYAPPWRSFEPGGHAPLRLGSHAVMPWLQRSAFFEDFDEEDLTYLSRKAVLAQYRSGEPIPTGTGSTDGLHMLVNGAVALYFSPPVDEQARSPSPVVFIRSLDRPGQIVVWSSELAPRSQSLTAVASQHTLLCFFPRDELGKRVQERPLFGLRLASRLLFLLGNQLRSTRVRLVDQHFEDECFSVRNLLQQAAPQLKVTSSLHEVPHLLANRLTHGEAFNCLERIKAQGTALETNLAGMCLDVLEGTRREWKFYQGMLKVYESVVYAPAECDAPKIRERCDNEFAQAFRRTHYVIEGLENLPDEPGHIFILNHLVNHPSNALPNHFEFALDTHFISAMILRPKYGDGGIRVVRRPRREEYGHQDYYGRLGYIFVVTKESDPDWEGKASSANRLDEFVAAAGKCLSEKINLVICPEGTSLWSEESPGPFKPGAFFLAGSLESEPLIVPIAVANFDKRFHNTTLAVVIEKPLRISDHVAVHDKGALTGFLREYRATYRGYVQRAQRLADTARGPQPSRLS
jgi:CRP-like cAMP-binding protein